LSNSAKQNQPITLDGESGEVLPTPPIIHLKSINDIRLEMAKVYREMRSNAIEAQQGTRLVYVLSAIGKLIELHEIEQRISKLEEGANK
jgi:hypothetical protein